MTINKIEMQDENGNIYYPHTAANVVFTQTGITVEEALEATSQSSAQKGMPSTGYTPLVFRQSDIFVPVYTGIYEVTCIGKGGDSKGAVPCAGGAGGGFCRSLLELQAGISYTITIDSTAAKFSGPDITTMIANNGTDGGYKTSSTGGTASGGNLLNLTGGSCVYGEVGGDGGTGAGGGITSLAAYDGGNGSMASGGGNGYKSTGNSKGGSGIHPIYPPLANDGETSTTNGGNGGDFGGGGGANDGKGGPAAVIIRG